MTLVAYPIGELPPAQAALFMIAGLLGVTVAVFNRQFYWRKGWFAGGKPAPLWFGRLLFGIIGVVFFLVGAGGLFFR